MVTREVLRAVPLFASLTPEQLDAILAQSAEISLRPGESLIQEGDVASFFVLISGLVDVLKQVGGEEAVINHYATGDFFGEVPLLLGSRAVASIRASAECQILRLDFATFQQLITAQTEVSAVVLKTMLTRVDHLRKISTEAAAHQLTLVGNRWDVDCHCIRDFLSRSQIGFAWREPGDPALAEQYGAGLPENSSGPYVIFPNGEQMSQPSLRLLAERFHLQTKPTASAYDVAIVGGGPAGLAAAVYGASEGLSTLLVEREATGGQAGTSSRIENYLGFPNGLSGGDLSLRASQQAKRFGAEILVTRSVSRIQPAKSGSAHLVELDGDETITARNVIIASGVTWRKLAVPGEDALVGRGIYYGASRTESFLVKGKDVHLVGAGNSAGQAAMFFTSYARSVTLLVRGRSLADSMSSYLIEQLESKANVQVELNTEVIRVDGSDHLQSIVTRDKVTQQETERPAEFVFVFIGADAETDWLPGEIARNDKGYVLTGPAVADGWPLDRDPYLLETSVPGIFAAGDVRCSSVKRVAAGVGEGSMAIAFIHQFRRSRDVIE